MIKFYTNRELSLKLGINLAKLKRWSREFLSPDPLGGIQSGYARQYKPDDAFILILGGYLVGELKFTIPEAKQILQDLNPWFTENDFYFNYSNAEDRPKRFPIPPAKRFKISILRSRDHKKADFGLYYVVRGLISRRNIDHQGLQVSEERYIESTIDPHKNNFAGQDSLSCRMINISEFRNKFLADLKVP